jgi:lipopolysaccharide/colanic/teichoic acid biosynthesis glycosyltransferase
MVDEDLSLQFNREHTSEQARITKRSPDLWRVLFVTGAAVGDLLLMLVAAYIASLARYGVASLGRSPDLFLSIALPFLISGLAVNAFKLSCLENGMCSIGRALMALGIAGSIAAATAFAFKVSSSYSRLETGYFLVGSGLLVSIWRYTLATALKGPMSFIVKSISVMLGDREALARKIFEGDHVEFINVAEQGWPSIPAEDPALLDKLGRSVGSADRVLLAFSDADSRHAWISLVRLIGCNAEVVEPNLLYAESLGLSRWGGVSTVIVARGPLTLQERIAKRALDLGGAIVLLPILVPLMMLISLFIKLDSAGPVFFVQKRVGMNNRQIKVYKFRTMFHERTDLDGNRSASMGDDRVTRLGHYLRRTSLDELPQIINVLLGNMSLVGPRPHALGSRAGGDLFWEAVSGYWMRHSVKPGITGLAQMRGYRGGDLSRDDLKNRIDSDLEYLNQWSLALDIRILFQTVLFGILHNNAY